MRILERFIKNNTPYLGRLVLRIEKESNYKSTKKGFLNKVHLDLKIFKLVTRLIPKLDDRGWVVDPEKVALIEKYTGGIVKEKIEIDNESKSCFTRKHIFLTKNKKYVGDIFKGWWYYENQMVVFEEMPTNISVKYENRKIIGYFIITETENVMVRIGDRIFNEDYIPSKKEFNKKDWDKWRKNFYKVYYKALGWQKRELEVRGMFHFLPYNMRGLKKITNINEAKESAIKIYEYITKIENDKKQNPLYRKVKLKI
jgi:hypothetical protein